jgi:hypothetical protein
VGNYVSRSVSRGTAVDESVRERMSRAVVHSAAVVVALALVATACGSNSPTQPQPQPAPPNEVSGTITFANAGPDRAAISTYSEGGFVVQFRTAAWVVWTSYGKPAPAPVFVSPGDASAIGEIQITAGGAQFAFRSVDLYSSITPIPYTVVGTRAGAKQIEVSDTLPPGVVGNTFGEFRTVVNPAAGQLVDTLTLTLTNPSGAAGNPMGLDNIVLGR